MPTARRIVSVSAPAAFRCSSVSWACIMDAGTEGAIHLPHGLISEASIAHPADLFVAIQECCHLQSVVGDLLHAQWKGLHSHGNQKGVERALAHAHVPQT